MMVRYLNTAANFLLLLAACIIFLLPIRRRDHILCRGIVGGFAALLAAVPVALVPETMPIGPGTWRVELLAVVSFLFCVLFFLACGEVSVPDALYCSVWAMVSEQLVGELCTLLRHIIDPALSLGVGGWIAFSILIVSVCFSAIGFTIARWMPRDGVYNVGPRQLTSALALLVLFEALFHMILNVDFSTEGYGVTLFLAQVYCVTTLYLQDVLFVRSAMRQEIEILNSVRHQQKLQYELSRENIAVINRKCHDLKHQVAAMRAIASPEERERYLREVEDSVRIYDSMVKTGNEVLDTVLTEKSLFCEANRITVSCVADGNALAFMDPVDIYTILGNALDNAIECVSGFQDAERRIIDVLVCQERRSLLMRITNPLTEKLSFVDGLPSTTKEQNGYHGFGLRSIRHSLEKYGGFLTVNTDGGFFTLTMLVPQP